MRWVGGALSLLAATCLHAHEIHQSRAQAEFNAKTQKLEVSLTVFINDLEVALIRQCEREISLVKTPATEVDAQLRLFLAKNFIVTDAAGKAAPVEWVDREIEAAAAASGDPEVTLYFEVPLPQGLTGTTLRHIVFCDRFADQMNLVHLTNGGRSAELRFTKGEPSKRLGIGW